MTDGGGASLAISRDYKMAARELVPPAGGERCRLTMDGMGQLASFSTAAVGAVRFTYVDNSGLVESKETGGGAGLTYVYEYDDYGRMSAVVQPTGQTVRVDDQHLAGVLSELTCLLCFKCVFSLYELTAVGLHLSLIHI